MKESLASSNTFADIVSDPWHYNVSLYMFTNLMDKLGPQQAVSAMHSHYREVYYKTGKKMGSSDALAESLDSLDYNVLPYFASWAYPPVRKDCRSGLCDGQADDLLSQGTDPGRCCV